MDQFNIITAFTHSCLESFSAYKANYCIYTRVIRYEQPFIKEEKAVLLMSQFMRALAVNLRGI